LSSTFAHEANIFNPSKAVVLAKNPHRFFLAIKNVKHVGRTADFINKEHNSFNKTQTGFFGFLESGNDQNSFTALLKATEKITQYQIIN
jgi:hypothetical protein